MGPICNKLPSIKVGYFLGVGLRLQFYHNAATAAAAAAAVALTGMMPICEGKTHVLIG
jgi:hypothetical protein